MSAYSQADRTVLLVDDEPAITDVLVRALRKSPFELLSAQSAAEALEILERREVAVVVSDECMPGMRGAEFLRLLRRTRPRTMRLMLTGEFNVHTAAEAVNSAGVFRFLLKPSSASDVGKAIEDALEERHTLAARDFTQLHELARPDEPDERDWATFDRALARLWLAFQPIVDTQTGVTVAYEALARSREPGLESPDRMLAAAERLGRLVDFERRVRACALERLPALPAGCDLWLNLHPISLQDEELASPAGILAPWASRIVLEVTERSTLHGYPHLAQHLTALRSRGFRIAVDDLGSGYSGLNSFATLLPEYIKYDRELIDGLAKSNAKRSLVRSLNSVCSQLGVVSVAEGIETAEDREQAAAVGCALLQGYLLGRPRPEF
jgi:EAL domain-containing protein (putative c-di-GMP-specific phosphodiesterase class I)